MKTEPIDHTQKLIIRAHSMIHEMGIDQWNYVRDFLQLRKSVFVHKLGWELLDRPDGEFEQYDSPLTVYILATRGDKLLGGVRLLNTTYKNAKYSYMLRDSYLGILKGLPQEICFQEPPVSNDTWELTRLATERNANISKELIVAANAYLYNRNVKECLVLTHPSVVRLMKSLDLKPKALGPLIKNGSGKIRAFSGVITPAPSDQYQNF